MENPTNTVIEEMIGNDNAKVWNRLTAAIDSLYDMDRSWKKGFGDWVYEYKYRRGGKTLCTFYAKPHTANILIILGKNEREKLEAQRDIFSEQILALYDSTQTYHDGKWLWIPIEVSLSIDDILNVLKNKRKPNHK